MDNLINWDTFTLFLFIVMRMTGFVLINPIFGRSGLPGMFKAGMILVLAVSVNSAVLAPVTMPGTFLELALRLVLELCLGFLVSVVMNIFFYIPQLAGEVMDEQMGMAMAKTYDAGSQSSETSTSRLLNIMAILLFFAANGHHTLMRIMITSGELVPFGSASFGPDVAACVLELFVECTVMAVKLALPILAAELMGQMAMGILMKVIPQINVFAINIELKVLIGMLMLFLLIAPISDYLLQAENTMLTEIRRALALAT